MVLRSSGLRLSLFGACVFLAGAASLVLLPKGVSILAMLAGGMCVWSGFIWTMFHYYGSPPGPPPEA